MRRFTADFLALLLGLVCANAASAQIDPRTESRRVVAGDDDLLSAGLGLEGLRSTQAPGFANPEQPSATELRRRAVWQNFRALIDLSPTGGAGRDFGPRPGERIPGIEWLGGVRDADGNWLHTVLLQIPAHFDPRQACVIAVASSGSRGIWGALPTAGEWGLRHGCAVVHTDKGTGTGFADAAGQRAIRIDGTLADDARDPRVMFRPAASGVSSTSVLTRHAQSGLNPEAHWGQYLIDATRSAFTWLNREYQGRLDRPLTPANTTVIAAGISNGGGVVLRALELDRGSPRDRWFDGAVALEPNITVRHATGARTAYDYLSEGALLQPCAALAEADAPGAALLPLLKPSLDNWCTDLAKAGLLAGADTAARAAAARTQLQAAGYSAPALQLGLLNWQTQVFPSVLATYAAAYSRSRGESLPCDLHFGFTDANGRARVGTSAEWARVFSDSNGIPPTAGITWLLPSNDGPRSVPALPLPTVQCLRGLYTDAAAPAHRALLAGLAQLPIAARPGDRPVLVLHGRADGLILPQHSSHAYVAAASRHGAAGLRYIELQYAQHFDAFVAAPGMSERYVPTQPWLLAAIDAVYARLTRSRPLPPSQVVRTRPGEPLGVLASQPLAGDRIELRRGRLRVPE